MQLLVAFSLAVVAFVVLCVVPARVAGFQPTMTILEPNNGNTTLWPAGFADASSAIRYNSAGEREVWIVGGHEIGIYNRSIVRTYNIDKNEWTKNVPTTGPWLRASRARSCGTILHNNTFVLFNIPESPSPFDIPSIFLLDLDTLVSTEVAIYPGPNVSLSRPILVANPLNADEVILYGGSKPVLSAAGIYIGNIFTNDMYAFDIRTSTWRTVTYNGAVTPIPTKQHEGVVLGNSLYIFGGVSCPYAGYFCGFANTSDTANVSYRFDFTTSQWTDLTPISDNQPRARTGHSLSVDYDNKIIVLYGGEVGYEKLSDIWLFDVETFNWTQVPLGYPAPLPSTGQNFHPFSTNRMLLIAGINSFVTPNKLNRVAVIEIGPEVNVTTDDNTTSSSISQKLNVVLDFPNNVPSLTFTPLSKCDRTLDYQKFMRVQINQIDELYALNGNVALTPVQRVDFLRGKYEVNTTVLAGQSQDFDFTRNLGATQFGFSYSLQESPLQINYLGTKLQLQPSDIKLSVSIKDWLWAQQPFLIGGGNQTGLQLVLRTTLAVYGSTPFTQLLEKHDDQNEQTIFTMRSQDVQLTLGFSDLVETDSYRISKVKIYPKFSSESIIFLLDLPYFAHNLTYDPEFSVLLSEDVDNDCSSGDDQLLAIILPTVLGTLAFLIVAVVVAVGIGFMFWRRKRLVRRLTRMQRTATESDSLTEGSL